ncbi:cytochrome P450 2J4-like [Paroedura picta]|uniref:cytochrome P450 2J4-like n=1 Tax=Paroedura picta TaxID=143630 RepID=UPI004055D559
MQKLGMGQQGMQSQIEEEAHQLVESFARTKGKPTDPSIFIFNSVCNVICALVFGYQYSVDDKEFLKLLDAIVYNMKFGGNFLHLLYEMFPWLMKHIKWPYKAIFDSVDVVLSHARKETEAHRVKLDVHDPQDFIDYYLLQMEKSKNDPTSTYDEANLFQCISDFFIGGTDTTSATIQWALFLMVTHPDIQEKVQMELEDVFGSSQTISYQDRKKVPYTFAVIHEIQRFKCILLAGNPRLTVKDVTMLGAFIPKGTMVVPDVHSIMYDPEIWETPRKFNPNHFLDQDGKFVNREEFLIFGAGVRVCPGKVMAMMEFFIFFTSLLRAFTLKLPEGVTELSSEPIKGLTISPRPYKLCAVPRSSDS